MIGRTPGNIQAIRPMKDGVIADYVITEAMLRYFIQQGPAGRRFGWGKPEVMISVPAGVTSVEKRAVRDAALKAGAREAYLIEEPLAAAIGANVPISGPSGDMIIDIGGGTSEIAVIALGGIVVSDSLRVGGNRFDEAIASYIRKKYNLMVGDRTAEEVKIAIGTALPLERELTMEVRGRDLIAGLPRTIPITSSEVMEAIEPPLQQIVGAVRLVLEQTPPELSSDIIDKGMVMSGGGSLLRNIDKLLTQVTGVPCHVAENALNCVALRDRPRPGALRLLQEVARPADVMGGAEELAADARPAGASSNCTATRAPASTRWPTPPVVARAAARRGLTHLAITDHDRIDGALRASRRRAARADGHRRRGGQDGRWRPDRGLPARGVPPGMSAVETIAAVREQGGLVGVPHPFDGLRGFGRKSGADARVDRRTWWTGSRRTTPACSAARPTRRPRSSPASTGCRAWPSPTRTPSWRWAVTYNIVTGDPGTPEGLLASLSAVDFMPGRASFYVRAWTPFAKIVQSMKGNGRRRAQETRERSGDRAVEHHHHPIGEPLEQEADALINPEVPVEVPPAEQMSLLRRLRQPRTILSIAVPIAIIAIAVALNRDMMSQVPGAIGAPIRASSWSPS